MPEEVAEGEDDAVETAPMPVGAHPTQNASAQASTARTIAPVVFLIVTPRTAILQSVANTCVPVALRFSCYITGGTNVCTLAPPVGKGTVNNARCPASLIA